MHEVQPINRGLANSGEEQKTPKHSKLVVAVAIATIGRAIIAAIDFVIGLT